MEMQKKMYLAPVLEYTCYENFLIIGSKVGSCAKYLLWLQNYFAMDYPATFLHLPPSPLCLTSELILKIFSTPPTIQYFGDSIPPPPFVYREGGSNYVITLDEGGGR